MDGIHGCDTMAFGYCASILQGCAVPGQIIGPVEHSFVESHLGILFVVVRLRERLQSNCIADDQGALEHLEREARPCLGRRQSAHLYQCKRV